MGMGLALENRDESKKGLDAVCQESISHCPHCTCGTLVSSGFQGVSKTQLTTHGNLALARTCLGGAASVPLLSNQCGHTRFVVGHKPAFTRVRGTKITGQH